jgi:hypothetical protein
VLLDGADGVAAALLDGAEFVGCSATVGVAEQPALTSSAIAATTMSGRFVAIMCPIL